MNIGDKVKVEFESGNKLVGSITKVLSDSVCVAQFGRGEDKFLSGIRYTSWGGRKASWKEDIHTPVGEVVGIVPAAATVLLDNDAILKQAEAMDLAHAQALLTKLCVLTARLNGVVEQKERAE